MNWVDIIVIIILIITFLGGIADGVIKSFFSLLALIIAIPLAGLSYHLLAGALSFLPGIDWENFLGFLVTMGVIIVILRLILLLPRKLTEKVWGKGIVSRLLGGLLNLLGGVIGLTVFVLVLDAFPVFDTLERWVNSSSVITSLAQIFGFIQILLPDSLRRVIPAVTL